MERGFEPVPRRVFRHGPTRVALDSVVLLCCLSLSAVVLTAHLRWAPELVLFAVCAALVTLDDLVRPLYVMDGDGILLERTRRRWRPPDFVRWTSVVDAQRVGEDVVALGLNEGGWQRLRIGSLSAEERQRFIGVIRSSAIKLDARADFGHWEEKIARTGDMQPGCTPETCDDRSQTT